MKKTVLGIGLSMLLGVSGAMAQDVQIPEVPIAPQGAVQDWSYTGESGAAHWADIRPDYHACKDGLKQSPVNIANFYQENLPEITPTYSAMPLTLINTGTTVQLGVEEGNGFSADGLYYALKQIVFRTPSEHYMDGAPYPMEVQLIHRADDGTQAIVSVMMKLGNINPVLQGVLDNIPLQSFAEKTVQGVSYSVTDLLPTTLDYYKYEGSMTMPPCVEGVFWFVMKDPITVSEDQLRAFQALYPVNARPIQPLRDRIIKGD